jgi:hypothetical protein
VGTCQDESSALYVLHKILQIMNIQPIKINNMTPEEKAKELLDRFDLPTGLMTVERKQCALIVVDEILKSLEYLDDDSIDFFEQVKSEIEKL